MDKALAYGPASDIRPYIPEQILIHPDGSSGLNIVSLNRFWKVGAEHGSRMSPSEYEDAINAGKITRFGASEVYRSNFWPCIDTEGVIWFPRPEEKAWRAQRAQALMEQATQIVNNPIQTLNIIRACAHIGGINLSVLMERLETHRKSPSENLADIYRRIKPSSI